jgi:CubicO group peptidase (beta-lactamase class C family)
LYLEKKGGCKQFKKCNLIMNWNLFLKPIYTVLFIIGLHLQSCSPAQPQSETKKNQINQHVKTYHDYHQFNGAILVAFEGRVIYKKGFGKASFEWDIPNRPDTKFQIASVSKQFTSMLIMQLVAEGKLDLRTPIGNYLTDYPKPQGDLITIQHLLNHTSGIPNHTSFPSYRTDMMKFIRPESLIQTFQIPHFFLLQEVNLITAIRAMLFWVFSWRK